MGVGRSTPAPRPRATGPRRRLGRRLAARTRGTHPSGEHAAHGAAAEVTMWRGIGAIVAVMILVLILAWFV